MQALVRRRLSTLFYAGLLLFGGSPHAYALRSINYMASGQNTINDTNVNAASSSECDVLITNSSSVPQLITVVITGSVNGSVSGGGTDQYSISQSGTYQYQGTAEPGTHTDSNRTLAAAGSTGDNVLYVWAPPSIPAKQAATQEIKCYGSIQVADSSPTSPGFITASGILTTFQEAMAGAGLGLAGGTAKNSTTSPTQTVIVIGEGRPF